MATAAAAVSEEPATKFAKDQLKAIIERIERLEEEKKTISDDIRDVYAEAKGNDIWLRVVMLAPSASTSMFTTVLGDTDMTLMRAYFEKPQAVVAMGFSDDPQMGLSTDHFSGPATAPLVTQSLRTASLH